MISLASLSFLDFFTHDFLLLALATGLLLALSASLVGSSLVLRRFSYIGDGLSHVAFGAFALATVLNFAPLYFSLPLVILGSILILKTTSNSRLHNDTLIAIISTSSLALGTFLISINRGISVDLHTYLFGSILTLTSLDLLLALFLAIITLIIFFCFYHQIFALNFDPVFARAIGVKTRRFNFLLATLSSIIVVIGMRLVGSLLITALLIFPAVTAMKIAVNYRGVIVLSVFFGLISFFLGLIFSFLLSAPTGATIVLTHLLFFLSSSLFSRLSRQRRAV